MCESTVHPRPPVQLWYRIQCTAYSVWSSMFRHSIWDDKSNMSCRIIKLVFNDVIWRSKFICSRLSPLQPTQRPHEREQGRRGAKGLHVWLVVFCFCVCFFCFFLSVRLLSILRGHSVFSSPPQRPMTSDCEGFFYPRFYPLHLWERASMFPFECSVLNKGTTGTNFITSLVWRGPWLGIEPGTSRTRSQHYTTRLSRRRYS